MSTPYPTPDQFAKAQAIVDSDPVTRIFAACEWEELNGDAKVWMATIIREAMNRAKAEAEGGALRYRMALFAIDQAVVDGKVCDDVAWFGPAETLHDFIQSVLHPSEPAAVADLFPATVAA